jgi:15-cis-phytoene synthase
MLSLGRKHFVSRLASTRTEPALVSPSLIQPGLAKAYERCRELNRRYGRSYYLATQLLPAGKRPHVHALYGFTRWADEIVDAIGDEPALERERRLKEWGEAFRAGLEGAPTSDPLLPAVLDTIQSYGLDTADFERFLDSMTMDLSTTAYPTYGDLLQYMDGSAAVIGTMMLPILGVMPGSDASLVRESARQLGLGFQLTNMIRDVAEDLTRGRVYLPQADLDRFGVTRATLSFDALHRCASPPVRALTRFECARALGHYEAARPGLAMLAPRSRICIRAAFLIYGGILDEIGRAGYDVMRARARVPGRRRLAGLLAAWTDRSFRRRLRGWRVG